MRSPTRLRLSDSARALRRTPCVTAAGLLLATFAFAACGGDDPSGPSAGGNLDLLITGVSVVEGTVTGSFQSGSLPNPGGGPAVLMISQGGWTPGGTATLAVTTTVDTPPFDRLLLSSPDHRGFYRINFGSERSDVVLRLQISPQARVGPLTLRATGQRGDQTGPYDVETVQIGG